MAGALTLVTGPTLLGIGIAQFYDFSVPLVVAAHVLVAVGIVTVLPLLERWTPIRTYRAVLCIVAAAVVGGHLIGLYYITASWMLAFAFSGGAGAVLACWLAIDNYDLGTRPTITSISARLAFEASRRAAYQEWSKALVESVLLPFIRHALNNEISPSYTRTLAIGDAPGLRGINQAHLHIPTPATVELKRLASMISSGSFALSGPRGAGKTSILHAFELAPGRDITIRVSAPAEYISLDFILHLHKRTCVEVIRHVTPITGGIQDVRIRSRTIYGRLLRPELEFDLHQRVDGSTEISYQDLERLARSDMRRIQYLESYTGELSSKLGGKIADVSGKASLKVDPVSKTVPEAVADLRRLLNVAAIALDCSAPPDKQPNGRVIVAIDELDRMGSGDAAARFLNEIKGIFGVANCIYLTSVSDEALQDFELRSMGLRSIFDSTFDEVIRCDYVDFAVSARILSTHIIGMPQPFVALSYALSGGLPRELIRSARSIIEVAADDDHGCSLYDATQRIAGRELSRVTRTLRDKIITGTDPGAEGALLDVLERCPPMPLTPGCAAAYAHTISSIPGSKLCSAQAKRFHATLLARVYFLETLLLVFTQNLDAELVQRATGSEADCAGWGFGALARARRYLGVNEALVLGLLNRLRESWALPAGLRLDSLHSENS